MAARELVDVEVEVAGRNNKVDLPVHLSAADLAMDGTNMRKEMDLGGGSPGSWTIRAIQRLPLPLTT